MTCLQSPGNWCCGCSDSCDVNIHTLRFPGEMNSILPIHSSVAFYRKGNLEIFRISRTFPAKSAISAEGRSAPATSNEDSLPQEAIQHVSYVSSLRWESR
jgi:hypothetical protein